MDTIFALATSRGKAGIAVFRLSGTSAHQAAVILCGDLPPARIASVRKLRWHGEVLDEALVLVFQKGASFTGEAMVELHVHGGVAVVALVMQALSTIEGLRLAEAGEFTRRALENGRLDLAQVEGLADLIDAETEAQQRQAMRVLSGAIGRKTEEWRRKLIRAAALIEATIDFADEDVPVDVGREVSALLNAVMADLRAEVLGSKVAERLRDGFEVAIVGPPNIGKSTLLNTLAGREAALTSARAGTTRDVIEVRMNLSGIPVTVLDTAGLRDSDDEIEQLGIERGLLRADLADLRVILVDRSQGIVALEPRQDDIVVFGKADLEGDGKDAVSGVTGKGIDLLIKRIVTVLEGRVSTSGVMTRARHRVALERAVVALESAVDELGRTEYRSELLAADLWAAVRGLDVLVGRVDVEDLLDEIFASFCIGK